MNTQMKNGLVWVRAAIEEGYTYVKWDGTTQAKECPICHNHSKEGKYYGGNCIWFASAYLRHGMGMKNVKCACDGLLGGSSAYTMLMVLPRGLAQAFINSRLGYDRFRLIRKSLRGRLKETDLRQGDILFYYRSGLFWHAAVYMGDGRIIDCTSPPDNVSERSWKHPYPCRAALRYIG